MGELFIRGRSPGRSHTTMTNMQGENHEIGHFRVRWLIRELDLT